MNIKNRLKLLQSRIIKEDSEYCACPDAKRFEFLERRDETDTLINAASGFCEKCGKPIEKQTIVINFVKPKKPDWMTDERYAAL